MSFQMVFSAWKATSITLIEGHRMPGRGTTRIAAAVIVALALFAAPASAQFGGRGKHNRGGHDTARTQKVDDKDYKAALQRIPESKEKYDPWGIARPANPAKATK